MLTHTQVKILVPPQHMAELAGPRDELLKLVEASFDDIAMLVRGNEIMISGETEQVRRVSVLFEELLDLLNRGQNLAPESVSRSIEMLKDDAATRPSQILSDTVVVTHTGKAIRPKTAGQKHYVDEIRDKTIVFSIGPAGSGKTYLAVAMAIRALKAGEVSRIVLTRPAVEAGERLGFLPGDLAAKIDPYLRPLYDALYEMLEPDVFRRHVEQGSIEIAPLAFMRGRTLNDSFIILDEAQNTTPEQMKMFLTRLGFGSRAVVTGDVTQVDLPPGARSGLVVIEEILNDIPGVAFTHLRARDVVRHKIVQDIVEAYRHYAERSPQS